MNMDHDTDLETPTTSHIISTSPEPGDPWNGGLPFWATERPIDALGHGEHH